MAGASFFSSGGASSSGASFGAGKSAARSTEATASSSKSAPTPTAQSGFTDVGSRDVGATTYLEPITYDYKGKQKWVDGGRTFSAAVAPIGGEIAMWTTKLPSADPNLPPTLSDPNIALSDSIIYFAAPATLPNAVLSFYTETYTLFSSLQQIVASSTRLPKPSNSINARRFGMAEAWDKSGRLVGVDALLGPPGAETVGHMRRLVGMYLEEIMRLRGAAELDAEVKGKWIAVYHIFQLAQTLYLPQDGRGEGLLGEELLDWVNNVDPQPDNSIGTSIMSSREPWAHASFWPYVTRCLLRGFHLPASSFLRTLSAHPHQPISKIGILLATHLSLFPRSHNTTAYPLDHQFLSAHKMWLARFRAELSAVTAGRPIEDWLESDNGDDWEGWARDLMVVVDIMEGKKERVLEEAADWREAVGAWGILVDVGLRRDDLPGAMKTILAGIPVDASLLDDTIQSNLCRGEIILALQGCHNLDSWLAAHLSDVFDKLALIPDDEERFDTSLRDYFLLDYTDTLAGHPKHAALWRITADYLSAAGDEGRARLKSHILHTALGLDWSPNHKGREVNVGGMDGIEEGETEGDRRFEHFAELRECCVELRLEEEWKVISKIMADRLVRHGEYGLGATMSFQAEDGEGLSRIAEKIVDVYINDGPENFLSIIETLPTSLLNDAPLALQQLAETGAVLDMTTPSAVSIFAARLAFLSEFRDYLLYRSQDARKMAADKLVGLLISGIAPVGIWAVLLLESVALLEDVEILFTAQDTFELMRVLEDVSTNARYNPHDYLGQLSTLLQRTTAIPAAKTGTKGKGKGKEAAAVPVVEDWTAPWRKLEEVRLALARNLARAVVVGFDDAF